MEIQPSPEPQATGPAATLPTNVKVLGMASLVNDIASEMVYPLLGEFLKTLGGTALHLGLIEGLADSTSSLLKLFTGGWSDQAGKRRQFIFFGYGVAVLVRPVLAFIMLPWQLLAVRLTDRVGKGIRTAPRDALIADSTPPETRGRAFGFHRAMDHLGAAIGPLLALAFLQVWPEAYRPLFFLTLLPGLVVMAVLVLGLREMPIQEPKEPLRWSLAPFDRNFRLFLAAMALFTLGNASDLFLLWRLEELGVRVVWLPALWFGCHLVQSLGNWLVGLGVDRLRPRPFLLGGWLVYALIYLAFALVETAWLGCVLFLSYALFYALTEPAEKTLVANLVDPAYKGLAFGWFHAAIGMMAFPSSLLFGWLYYQWSALAAFGCAAILAALAAGLLLLIGSSETSQT